MHEPDPRYDGMGRMRQLTEKIDLAKSHHAHLNDDDLCPLIKTCQRQRQAQLIVLVLSCHHHLVTLATDLREQVLGAGLTLAASNGNDRSLKAITAPFSQFLNELLAIFCNVLWGCAFPFIKMGYRLFEIDPSNTASIFCFAGVRFMLGSLLVLLGSTLLQSRMPTFPKGKVFAECCVLGLWQTTTQYAFYYIAVAMLTGAFGGILNSTQSFLGVIFAHFIYGNADRMTPAKTLGCVVGFAGVLIGTLGNHGGGSGWGVFCMLFATVVFTLSGPWNKSVTKKADSFAVCFLNLFVGGAALFVLGTALGGRLGSVTPLGILVLLYLAFICGAGYLLWALLMKNNPVSRIAIFGFVNPVVNVLLSAVLNGEPLFRWQYLAALVFVCVGIWLVNKAPAKNAKKEKQ